MRKILLTLVILTVIITLPFTAFATATADIKTNGEVVVDAADLLTDEQEADLTEKINAVNQKYNFELVILTTPNLYGKTQENFTADFYDYNDYGESPDYDGLVYMVSMEERIYYTMATGYGMTAFTGYAYDYIGTETSSYLSNGDYYHAFERFIEISDQFLEKAKTGSAYSYNNTLKSPKEILYRQMICIIGALVVGAIVTIIARSKMNNAIKQQLANEYIDRNSFFINQNRDTYLYSRTTRTAKPKNNSSGGSGGSRSFTGSSGRSHSGGGGSF